MSASLGCTLLSSCTGGGGGGVGTGGGGGSVVAGTSATPIPNGYAFFPIYAPGQQAFSEVSALTPQVMLDEANHVLFGGQRADDSIGLYQLTVDWSHTPPRVVDRRRIVTPGDRMPDGRVIAQVVSTDVDDAGRVGAVLNYDITVGKAGQGPASVVVDGGKGLDVVIDYDEDIPGNQGSYGADFGDIDVQGGDLMVVGRYGGDGATAQGLFYLPQASGPQARIVLNSGQEVPNADGDIECFGLIDLDEHGEYVVQAFGSNPLAVPKSGPRPGLGSVILHSNVERPASQARLLAACPSLPLTRGAQGKDTSPSIGTSIYGPRIGGTNITSHVTEDASGTLTLYRGDAVVARTGLPSPGGSTVRSMMSAVLNDNGLMFYELITDSGLELCVHNGQSAALILARGAAIGGVAVDTIAFGFHTTQVDAAGRLVCYAQMSNGQEVILAGIPV